MSGPSSHCRISYAKANGDCEPHAYLPVHSITSEMPRPMATRPNKMRQADRWGENQEQGIIPTPLEVAHGAELVDSKDSGSLWLLHNLNVMVNKMWRVGVKSCTMGSNSSARPARLVWAGSLLGFV